MSDKHFKIDGHSYNRDLLNDQGKKILDQMQYVEVALRDKKNMVALLNKAKKAYLSEIKLEVVSAKAGFDF